MSPSIPAARRSYERHIVPFVRPFADSTLRRAEGSIPNGGLALDHGAGTGLVTSLLLRRQPDVCVVAVDPNADLLGALRGVPRCSCVVGTAVDIGDEHPPFDAVLSNIVLPFCPDAAGDLAHLRKRTSASGVLMATTLGPAEEVTPFFRFWSAAREVMPDAWEPSRYPHHRFGNPEVFTAEIAAGGWRIRSVHRVRAVRRITVENAWTWLSSVLPIGVGEGYRPMSEDERDAVHDRFVGRWPTESRWISMGWTVVASAT